MRKVTRCGESACCQAVAVGCDLERAEEPTFRPRTRRSRAGRSNSGAGRCRSTISGTPTLEDRGTRTIRGRHLDSGRRSDSDRARPAGMDRGHRVGQLPGEQTAICLSERGGSGWPTNGPSSDELAGDVEQAFRRRAHVEHAWQCWRARGHRESVSLSQTGRRTASMSGWLIVDLQGDVASVAAQRLCEIGETAPAFSDIGASTRYGHAPSSSASAVASRHAGQRPAGQGRGAGRDFHSGDTSASRRSHRAVKRPAARRLQPNRIQQVGDLGVHFRGLGHRLRNLVDQDVAKLPTQTVGGDFDRTFGHRQCAARSRRTAASRRHRSAIA